MCCLRTVDGAFGALGEMNVSSQELQAAMGEVSLAGIDSSKILQTLSSCKAEHTEENKRLVVAFKNLAARARSEGKPAGRLNESLFSSLKKSITKSLKRFRQFLWLLLQCSASYLCKMQSCNFLRRDPFATCLDG